MEVRKLRINEHHNTRKLWELVFKEDTSSFLDYYYTEKTSENEIYVVEEKDEIRGMLQLNPYKLKVGESQFLTHYIVAVATHPDFRKQGIMKKLLHRSLQDMYNNKEAFTFLMPAAEAIYLPFDFRFVYKQKQGKILGSKPTVEELKIRKAQDEDFQMLADFANHCLRDKEIYALRDVHYYQCLRKEMQSENGDIIIIEEKDSVIGFYLYAKTSQYIIREPFLKKGKEQCLADAIMLLTSNVKEAVECLGYEGEMLETREKEMIMFRALHPEMIFETMKARENMELTVEITDPIITENNRSWRLQAKQGEYVFVSEHIGVADIKVSIAELSSVLFGYEVNEQFSMLQIPNRIFLNEVV